MSKKGRFKQSPVDVQFAPATAIHLLVLGIMVIAIGASLSKYFGWIAGILMGLALTYVFSALAKTLLAPAGVVSRLERTLSGLFALTLFAVTMGLSYGSLYATMFAKSSALNEFQRVRLPVQRQLELVLANAEGSVAAFAAWQEDSLKKAVREGQGGGTCPSKATSLGKRGPIAMWRESEAEIAANLHSELKSSVENIRRRFNALYERKANSFSDTMEITTGLNALIEASEALARGSYIKATQQTLTRQLQVYIQWTNGEIFKCGDNTRNELIERAQAALTELSDVKKNPPISPIAPAIDLSNQQELTIRGLLRAFNGIAMVVTAGTVGSFADDSLMLTALNSKGLINRETLGFFIAGLIELCVLFTAFISIRSGSAPFPFQPTQLLADLQMQANQQSRRSVRLAMQSLLAGFKLLINLLFARQSEVAYGMHKTNLTSQQEEDVIPDPIFPLRELSWGLSLLPYYLANQDGDYLVVPNINACAKALAAASALEFQRFAERLSLDASWPSVATYGPIAMQLERLLPNARNLRYAIYKVTAPFAQAMRLQMLESMPQK